jgi:hypothetical protein
MSEDSEMDAFGVAEFARRHDISKAYVYLMWKRNEGPEFLQVGSRRLITREAAAAWRASLASAPRTVREDAA